MFEIHDLGEDLQEHVRGVMLRRTPFEQLVCVAVANRMYGLSLLNALTYPYRAGSPQLARVENDRAFWELMAASVLAWVGLDIVELASRA